MLPKNKMRPLYLEKLKIYREELDMVGFPNVINANSYKFIKFFLFFIVPSFKPKCFPSAYSRKSSKIIKQGGHFYHL